jgi:large subunit ribosomal protein L1
MSDEEKFLKAFEKLKEEKKESKFDQTIDLIVNLKNFDVRREAFNTFIFLPHKIKDKKVIGFLEKDSHVIETIKKDDFGKFKEKKDIKNLIKKYDFFVSNAKLMPAVATSFGRVLGPVGKMPSPQLGILMSEDEKSINELLKKINSSIRIRVKEPSIKIGVAKQSLSKEAIIENLVFAYNRILDALPKKRDNIRNVKIKLTMGKPIAVEI